MYTRSLIAGLFALLCAGCSESSQLVVGPDALRELQLLRERPKYRPHQPTLYPGAPSPEIRGRCEAALNVLLDQLITGLEHQSTTDFVFQTLESGVQAFAREDSEEIDRTFLYFEEVMDILGIESSGGRLNRWRYGLDPDAA